jgi:GntR family transcriptional regulator, arabinose operon transcriptional repressor
MLSLEKDNPLPLYLQVKEGLRRQVQAGVYDGERGLPDERVLAQQLGLSRTTVRRAIMELTEEGLLGRIRGRGTFVRAADGARKAGSRRLTVGLLSFDDHIVREDGLFYDRVIASMQTELGPDATIVLRKISRPYDAYIAKLTSEGGLNAFAALGIDDEMIDILRQAAIPSVLVDCARSGSDPAIDEVTHAGESPAYDAVRSLLELGHRDIGLMVHGREDTRENGSPVPGWRMSPYARERLRGYERALSQANCLRPDRILSVVANSTAAYGRMRAVLSSGSVPTAVFCTTDEIAIGVIQAVKDHGWRVPEHMSVVGFGDSGYFCTPLLSTVRIRVEEMGAVAIRLLRARLEQPSHTAKRISVPTEWMPRGTCDVPRR